MIFSNIKKEIIMSLGINVTTVAIRPELEEVVSKPLPYIDIIRGDALKKTS